MEVKFIKNRMGTKTALLQINGAKICFRNFEGRKEEFNNEGDRNFAIIIPDEEIAELLKNDLNELGVGWNVKIKAPRVEGEMPFMYLPVKVGYSDKSQPDAYMIVGDKKVELSEFDIKTLDNIDIAYCDLDIRPYDSESRFGRHRTAYLQGIWAVQDLSRNRFARRMVEDDGYMED